MKMNFIGFLFGSLLALNATGPWSDTCAEEAPTSLPLVKPGEPRSGWDLGRLKETPVLSGGRLKPLDTLAREMVLFLTGSRKFGGFEPLDLLLSWVSFPESWRTVPFLRIGREDVKRQLGLPVEKSLFSPDEIATESFLAQYARELGAGGKGQAIPIEKLGAPNPREDELKRVVERISTYRALVEGYAWPVVPMAGEAPWLTLAQTREALQEFPEAMERGREIRNQFVKVFASYMAFEPQKFEESARTLHDRVWGEWTALGGTASQLDRVKLEVRYSALHPFMWAWIFYLIGALTWVAVRVLGSGAQKTKRLAFFLTSVGFLLHVGGMAMRILIAGRPPVTNMYESIIWVSFGVMFFAGILYLKHRQAVLMAAAGIVATLTLIAADAAPTLMDPGLHPLVPVLRSNYWLTVHVLTITLGYSAFALSLGIANVSLFQYIRKRATTAEGVKRVVGLNHLAYRAMQFGVVLLSAGTILGGIWADESWGRFWGWDPKEVWALIALLGYVAILHARFTGWMKEFGFAAWTVASFLLVVMAWYGVNFVLGVGLHSYGFSSGGQGWVALFSALQLGYVGMAYRSARVSL